MAAAFSLSLFSALALCAVLAHSLLLSSAVPFALHLTLLLLSFSRTFVTLPVIIAMTTTTESAPVADTQANTEATTEPVATDEGANKEPATTTGPSSPKKEPKPNVHKQDFEKDVVYLYQFPRSPTIPSVSAYCLKVETFLRVTGVKYEVRSSYFFLSLFLLSSF